MTADRPSQPYTATTSAAVPCLCVRLGKPFGRAHLVGCSRRPRDVGSVSSAIYAALA